MTRISVIMGIYNCSSTLPEAIESLINQTYKNWNLVMCDDGSEDNTYEAAKKYQERYPDKIILIKNERNMGLNYTLNRCLKHADGEYIARMDGDDISLPERLEKEVDFLDSHPEYAIVSPLVMHFDENGVFSVGRAGGEPDIRNFPKKSPFCHAACMIRREAYDEVGGYTESPKVLRVEDRDLWIKLYEKGYRGFVLSMPLYMVRDDKNAYSRRTFQNRVNSARVVASTVKRLGLPKKYYIWALRPIIVWLLPPPLYMFLHKRKWRYGIKPSS